MRYAFHPEALSEYAEAVQYYTQQRAEVVQAFINAIFWRLCIAVENLDTGKVVSS